MKCKQISELLCLGILLFILSSCQKMEPQILQNVKYGSNERHTMDVFLPKDRNPNTPFVILIHPGAWMSGDKSLLNRMADSLYQNGIAVANINTRFVSRSEDVSIMIQDIDSVLAYCKANSKLWHTRSSRFGIGGSSSGGHLAILYAYTAALNDDIATVIAFATPSNVADSAWLRATNTDSITEKVTWMTGKPYTLGTIPDSIYFHKSPLYNIKSIPTLLFHGDLDEVVPFSQSEQMYQALQRSKVPSKFIPLKGLGHVVGYQYPDVFANVILEMVDWLQMHK